MRNRNRKIVVFYHVYQTGGWVEMMWEQVYRLTDAGLLDTARVFMGVNGSEPMGIEWTGIEYVRHKSNNEEADTLKLIRDYCARCEPSYVLYIHTKGVSRQTPFTEDWRRMMEYFVIDRWEHALDILGDEGAVGCNLQSDTFMGHHPHFSGGMWWATSEHINALNHSYLDGPTRWHREFWIGTAGPLKCLHESGLNTRDRGGHYEERYPQERYVIQPLNHKSP